MEDRNGLPGQRHDVRFAHFHLRRSGNACVLDDKTWRDLELAAFFHQLDTTVTKPGSQYLYNQLRTFEFDSDIQTRRYATYLVLVTDARLREALQLALAPLDADSAAYIAEVLFGRGRRTEITTVWIAGGEPESRENPGSARE